LGGCEKRAVARSDRLLYLRQNRLFSIRLSPVVCFCAGGCLIHSPNCTRASSSESHSPDVGWYPPWEGDRINFVCPRGHVLLVYCGQAVLVEQLRQPHYCCPESPMNVGNLPFDQAAHKNLIAITHRTGRPEYWPSLFVSPPTAADRLSGYGFGQVWSWSLTSL
jgi:hypothetical protein